MLMPANIKLAETIRIAPIHNNCVSPESPKALESGLAIISITARPTNIITVV